MSHKNIEINWDHNPLPQNPSKIKWHFLILTILPKRLSIWRFESLLCIIFFDDVKIDNCLDTEQTYLSMYFWMNKTIWFLVLLLCLQYSLYDVSANEKEPSQDLNIKGNFWKFKIQPDPPEFHDHHISHTGQHSGLYQGPYFSGLSQARVVNLTVGERKTVHLPCQVRQLASNSLSWVRNTDSTIISIDTDIVTHDKRFMIIESSNRESWVLIIRYDI